LLKIIHVVNLAIWKVNLPDCILVNKGCRIFHKQKRIA
jgi:hypothetical protein